MSLLVTSDPTLINTLAERGISPEALGIAYMFLVANAAFAGALFMVCRSELLISPNRASRSYALFMALLMGALLVAGALENELLPPATTLPYAIFPHILLLLIIHLWVYYRHEPWLIALGISSTAGLVLPVVALGFIGLGVRPAHWVIVGVATALLITVWMRACTTKRAFLKSSEPIRAPAPEGHEDISSSPVP